MVVTVVGCAADMSIVAVEVVPLMVTVTRLVYTDTTGLTSVEVPTVAVPILVDTDSACAGDDAVTVAIDWTDRVVVVAGVACTAPTVEVLYTPFDPGKIVTVYVLAAPLIVDVTVSSPEAVIVVVATV